MYRKKTLRYRVIVKVKVLTSLVRRPGLGDCNQDVGVCDVIDNINNSVKTMFVAAELISKFQKGKFYSIRGVALGDVLRVSEKTMVLECAAFEYEKKIEDAHLKPQALSVHEALSSPRKRRISVQGTLSDVSDVFETGQSQRKVLKIGGEGEEFVVKLWGNETKVELPLVGSEVAVTCLDVVEYRGRKEGTSSSITKVVEIADETSFAGKVDAAAFECDDSWIVIAGKEDEILRVDSAVLKSVFPNLTFKGGVRVEGRRKGCRVLTIRRSNTVQE